MGQGAGPVYGTREAPFMGQDCEGEPGSLDGLGGHVNGMELGWLDL